MYITDSNINITEIILAVCVKAGTGNDVHNNRASHGIAYNKEGIKKYVFKDGKTIVINKNEIIYLPKHSNYSVASLIDGDCWAINFNNDTEGIFPPMKFEVNDEKKILNMFSFAEDLWMVHQSGFELKIKSILYDLLYMLKKDLHDKSLKDMDGRFKKILPAANYIEKNYTKPININILANLCNMSDTYFRRIFFEKYKTTPIKYVNEKRMLLAESLLSSNMYKIKDIQKICGYSEPCIFSREFKKYFGCSPSDYINNLDF